VASDGADHVGANAVASDGADHVGANAVASDGADHVGANAVASDGADHVGAHSVAYNARGIGSDRVASNTEPDDYITRFNREIDENDR
jgi:cobalamin biosynthesis protein CbiG